MGSRSPDTHPDAERVQLELLRHASVARRVGLVRSLSATAIQLARRAIRRRHPEAGNQELAAIFVALHYGPELAERLRAYWEGRQP